MAKTAKSQPAILTSILDRLLDDEPHLSEDPPKSTAQVLRELKHSVRRDLENLLNTRWRCEVWPPDLDQLELSLVNYGIPDFCGGNLGADNPEELLKTIEFAIRHFEPRLKNVRVTALDSTQSVDRNLRFRIDAVLSVEPFQDRVAYDSALEMTTGNVEVKGAAR